MQSRKDGGLVASKGVDYDSVESLIRRDGGMMMAGIVMWFHSDSSINTNQYQHPW